MWVIHAQNIPPGMFVEKLAFEFNSQSALKLRQVLAECYTEHSWVCPGLYPLRMELDIREYTNDQIMRMIGKNIRVQVDAIREYNKFKLQIALVKMKRNLGILPLPCLLVGSQKPISNDQLIEYLKPAYPNDSICELYGISEIELDETIEMSGHVTAWIVASNSPVQTNNHKPAEQTSTRLLVAPPTPVIFDLESVGRVVKPGAKSPVVNRSHLIEPAVDLSGRKAKEIEIHLGETHVNDHDYEQPPLPMPSAPPNNNSSSDDSENSDIKPIELTPFVPSRPNTSQGLKEGDLYKGRFVVQKGKRGGLYYINSSGKKTSIPSSAKAPDGVKLLGNGFAVAAESVRETPQIPAHLLANLTIPPSAPLLAPPQMAPIAPPLASLPPLAPPTINLTANKSTRHGQDEPKLTPPLLPPSLAKN